MAIAKVQSQPATILVGGVTSAQSGAYASNPTVNNHLIAQVAHWNNTTNTTASGSDTAGNTWTTNKAASAPTNSQQRASIASAKVTATGASFKVTVTISAATSDIFFNSEEWSGLDTTTWVDSTGNGTAGKGANTTSLSVTTGTTSSATELLICALGAVSNSTANGISDPPTVGGVTTGVNSLGVSQDASTIDGGEFAYKILSATGAQTVAWSYNSDAGGDYVAVVQGFIGASTGNAFSSTETATLTGTGASTAADPFSASATATPQATGASTATDPFNASASATASGTGASTAAAPFSATGTATAAAAGASIASAAGSITATATPSAVGAATASGPFSASGVAQANGIGAATAAGAASSTGTATALGVSGGGGVVVSAAGSITASAMPTATGAATAAAAVSTTATAAPVAAGASTAAAAASANASAILAGVGTTKAAAKKKITAGTAKRPRINDDELILLASMVLPLITSGRAATWRA